MRRAAIAITAALCLLVPASASAKTTADFTYKSSGKAAAPGAVACWSTAHGQPTAPFPPAGQAIKGLAFISEGRGLLILSGQYQVY